MTNKRLHIMILTGEPSGDFHAGPLIRHLKTLSPGVLLSGIGGPVMQEANVDLFFNIDRLSAMGLIQVAKQFSAIKAAFSAFKNRLATDRPDLLILIDYPGFNLRAAALAKTRYNIPVLYYIAPKVWAWNASRIYKIKAFTDHVALILPFELPLYKKKGITATYVGNPLTDEYPFIPANPPPPDPAAPVVGLLPGSRTAEIAGLLEIMLSSASRIQRERPGVRFLISAASKRNAEQIRNILESHPVRFSCTIIQGRPLPIFQKAHVLIAASGTVTLEAALCAVPTILIYRVSALTWRLGKLMVKVKYVGLANLIAGQEVMPELLQDKASPDRIACQAVKMLLNPVPFRKGLEKVRQRLGTQGAPERTARLALDLVRRRKKFDKPG